MPRRSSNMSQRLLASLVAVVAIPVPGIASVAPPDFNAQNLTWASTDIVVVEGGKVVESWKGNLKPGDKLPDGAAEVAAIRIPDFDTDSIPMGAKPPVVTGKRMVLFLAHVPSYGAESKKPVWMDAHCPGFPSYPPSPAGVAWVEGDRVYTVVGVHGSGAYALRADGTVAGLKEKIELGLSLQARFEAAKADRDAERRADRLVALLPTISAYSDLWALGDLIVEIGRCGKAGVPHLARWAVEPRGKYTSDAMCALCQTGDVGLDAVTKILDAETGYWKGVAAGLKPGQTVRRIAPNTFSPWGTPNGLYHLLSAVRRLKLSAGGEKRIREHPGLVELDRLLTTQPAMKLVKSDMEPAHEILQKILA